MALLSFPMPYHVLTIHFRDVVGRPMKRRLVVGCGSRLSLFRPAPLAVLLAVGRFFPLVSPLRHLPQVSGLSQQQSAPPPTTWVIS